MLSTPEDKIVAYLMNHMEDVQDYVNNNDAVPDFVLFDVVVRRIEESTGCNYVDILTHFDQTRFNKLFMIGDSNVQN